MDEPGGQFFDARDDLAEPPLTPGELIRLEYYAPPADLSPFVTTFFRVRCDELVIRDVQPASMGQLYVYLSGEGSMHFAGGRSDRAHRVTLMGPLNRAASFDVAGPFDLFGAVLAPLGWVALTDLDAADYADRLRDAAEVLGPVTAELDNTMRALAARDDGGAGEAMRDAVSDFLRPRLRPLPARHVALVQAVVEWLGGGFNPSVDDLYARTGYSPRQTQRLVARYFGCSPVHLVRKYRATRIAALLSQPDVDDDTVAMLVDQFYDQPHMIREMREFLGRTPKRLGAGDAPILDAVVNVRNFYQIKTPV